MCVDGGRGGPHTLPSICLSIPSFIQQTSVQCLLCPSPVLGVDGMVAVRTDVWTVVLSTSPYPFMSRFSLLCVLRPVRSRTQFSHSLLCPSSSPLSGKRGTVVS